MRDSRARFAAYYAVLSVFGPWARGTPGLIASPSAIQSRPRALDGPLAVHAAEIARVLAAPGDADLRDTRLTALLAQEPEATPSVEPTPGCQSRGGAHQASSPPRGAERLSFASPARGAAERRRRANGGLISSKSLVVGLVLSAVAVYVLLLRS